MNGQNLQPQTNNQNTILYSQQTLQNNTSLHNFQKESQENRVISRQLLRSQPQQLQIQPKTQTNQPKTQNKSSKAPLQTNQSTIFNINPNINLNPNININTNPNLYNYQLNNINNLPQKIGHLNPSQVYFNGAEIQNNLTRKQFFRKKKKTRSKTKNKQKRKKSKLKRKRRHQGGSRSNVEDRTDLYSNANTQSGLGFWENYDLKNPERSESQERQKYLRNYKPNPQQQFFSDLSSVDSDASFESTSNYDSETETETDTDTGSDSNSFFNSNSEFTSGDEDDDGNGNDDESSSDIDEYKRNKNLIIQNKNNYFNYFKNHPRMHQPFPYFLKNNNSSNNNKRKRRRIIIRKKFLKHQFRGINPQLLTTNNLYFPSDNNNNYYLNSQNINYNSYSNLISNSALIPQNLKSNNPSVVYPSDPKYPLLHSKMLQTITPVLKPLYIPSLEDNLNQKQNTENINNDNYNNNNNNNNNKINENQDSSELQYIRELQQLLLKQQQELHQQQCKRYQDLQQLLNLHYQQRVEQQKQKSRSKETFGLIEKVLEIEQNNKNEIENIQLEKREQNKDRTTQEQEQEQEHEPEKKNTNVLKKK
ncbi:ensconsin isoform f [Anaeramoeba flamelloides]|uniref:Ensconsin isoform f n=1 Tax=Anaeramoeba flamelloides TaxID=1746091 RepID=A0AAV7YMQ7_9EUKA|nr:ensconsin isoform f [Anaeramoeba flamelloides]